MRTTGCDDCRAGLAHCHGTLVVHADGTLECDGVEVCGAEEALHEWWVPCTELVCGCTGDEMEFEPVLLLAA
jgi:hypothetical protein